MDREATENEVIRLLELALSGGDVSQQNVMVLADADFSASAGKAWHQLAHWVADNDIRARDSEYASTQREVLAHELAALTGSDSGQADGRPK